MDEDPDSNNEFVSDAKIAREDELKQQNKANCKRWTHVLRSEERQSRCEG